MKLEFGTEVSRLRYQWFFIFSLVGLLSGCVNSANKTQQVSQLESTIQDELKESLPILEDEYLPVKDVLEDGFCYDDIYATYLKKESIAKAEIKIRKYKSKKYRRHMRRRAKSRSLFHARAALVGPTKPYYGAIPVTVNDKVEFWMQYFKTRGRRTFIKWLVRSQNYKNILSPMLEREGLPKEFLFLAMVESGFSNTAYSRMRATGTWQFMKGTAQLYNLKIDHWVDERRNPEKSTIAAARYLRDLYAQFGDWYLAMAAYNAGPGKIRSAIRRSKSRDFWKISQTRYIRKETKHYVPKVLAALNLASNLKLHGFDIQKDPKETTPVTYVKIEYPVELTEVATKLEIPVKTLKKWNPELIRSITPPLRRDKFYPLILPTQFMDKFEQIKSKLSTIEVTDVLMHRVRSGDTLSAIAQRYKVTIRKIRSLNPRLRAKALRIGKKIAIPIPGIVNKKRAQKKNTKKDFG